MGREWKQRSAAAAPGSCVRIRATWASKPPELMSVASLGSLGGAAAAHHVVQQGSGWPTRQLCALVVLAMCVPSVVCVGTLWKGNMCAGTTGPSREVLAHGVHRLRAGLGRGAVHSSLHAHELPVLQPLTRALLAGTPPLPARPRHPPASASAAPLSSLSSSSTSAHSPANSS